MTQESPAATQSRTSQLLRAAGLRVTSPRVAVLQALTDLQGLTDRSHPDAETLTRAVRERLGAVSSQAVYDVLAALCRTDLVRRIEPAGSPARFEKQTGDRHHHLVCRHCGTVADVERAPAADPCLTPDHTRGFVIDDADVTFWGLCPACQSWSDQKSGFPERNNNH